ncbi:MAG: DUF3943 domain-containing protein [Candidatus Saccharicenans sp.]
MRKKIILSIILIAALASNLLAGQKNNRPSVVETFICKFSLRLSDTLKEQPLNGPGKKLSFSFDDRQEASPFLVDPEQFEKITSLPRHKLRAFLEFFSLFAYSGINYNIKYSKFIEDWQYKFIWKDQKRRYFTFEAQRFDSNNFGLNWRHSLAGLIYYEFARSNNLTWWQSTLYSMGGSLAWEYLVEWREVISINDNLMTGPGGFVLGESLFQLGQYFLNSPNKFSRLLSWFNPLMKINGWFDRKHPLPPYFHAYNPQAQDVYFFIGYRQSPTSTSAQEVSNLDISFNSRIITRQDYGIPGKVREKFTQPIYSQLDLEMMYHGKNREELDLMAKVVPFGWFAQNISDDKKGYSYYYGLGSALEVYLKRPVVDYDAEKFAVNQPDEFHFEVPRDFRDKLGAIHILGPVFDLAWFARPWYFHLCGEAYLSFGMINSLPLNKYSIDHDIRGMKTTLTYFGYYYALGPALKYRIDLGYSRLRLRGFLEYLYYHSLQGRDRFQNDLLDDSPLRDSRWDYGLDLQYQIPGTSFSIESRLEWVKRWGLIHEIADHNLEKRLYLGLKINL